MSSLKPSSVSANYQRLGWTGGGGLFSIIKCSVRSTDSELSVVPCRNTNSSASKWQFKWRMLFYRGDKLQVSLVALSERFRAACQLAEWEPEFWQTAAPDRAQSPRSVAVTRQQQPSTNKEKHTLRISHPLGNLIQWWLQKVYPTIHFLLYSYKPL